MAGTIHVEITITSDTSMLGGGGGGGGGEWGVSLTDESKL